MATKIMSEAEIEEKKEFEAEIASTMRKYKRRLKRSRQVGLENKEIHVSKSASHQKYNNDIDAQYEAYLRTGCYDEADVTF